jgi:hypothetical protein
VTTGLEDKQAILGPAWMDACPFSSAFALNVTEWQRKVIKFYHLVHLKEHPEVECSCR